MVTKMIIQQEINDQRWAFAALKTDIDDSGILLVRLEGKQIALFLKNGELFACNNRCPHEGYPLVEGDVSNACILTCNWHNWKFDLRNGDNLYGGDRLRTFPVDIRGTEIWLDLQDPPLDQQIASIKDSLRDAFDDYAYDRISRETARLIKVGGDPIDVLRLAVSWSFEKLEFGWTHAYAGMSDWLSLYLETSDVNRRLVCLTEAVSHVAYDVLRETTYPFSKKVRPYVEEDFVHAVEIEDEELAISMIAGGLREGLVFADFEPGLSKAALAHYLDFGHCLIYVTKVDLLINTLGQESAEPLLFSLVRSFIYASREDQIPEFRYYHKALNTWSGGGSVTPLAANWRRKGIYKSLRITLESSNSDPLKLYQQLLMANAISLLTYDENIQNKTRVSVAKNVGWLDFTHGLTFANAVHQQCIRFPELWAAGLLQMACFVGRNSAFTYKNFDMTDITDKPGDITSYLESVIDHGITEHIVSVHLIKTTLSVQQELCGLSKDDGRILLAALDRFLNGSIKRRHTIRTAHQSLQFVAKE